MVDTRETGCMRTFTTIVQPHDRAGATFHVSISAGKFHLR